jgi:hypothetical protein
VRTEPAGAAITVDGRDTKQVTPATVVIAGGGVHRLRLSKKGFASRDEGLTDGDLQAGTVTYTLQPGTGAGVSVEITSTYPVEVFQGTVSLSAPSDSHHLTVTGGTRLRVSAPQYLLDHVVVAEGKSVEYQAPALGYLTVLTKYETCSVTIGSRDFGYPPFKQLALAAGQYRLDTMCPNGQNPLPLTATVPPNGQTTARFDR